MKVAAPRSTVLDVLHIIPRFIGGGPERSLLAYAVSDRNAGIANRHRVVVLEAPASLDMFLAARRAAVELIIRPRYDVVERLIEDADIVQIHFWNHPALATLLRTVAFPPARVLVWARILGVHAPQVLTEEAACFGDRLLLTSKVSEDSVGAKKARTRSIPVDYVPGIADMSRLDGFKPNEHEGVCIGYIGLVSPVKMHQRFAEMSAEVRLPDARFVVCGSGGGETELRSRISALGMSARVDIRGHVENVREALEEFDIFGYPLVENTYATSEKALQEAMWVGIPPVVFPHGGLRDLVEHDHTGIVVTTEDEYARALERLAQDIPLRVRLGNEARRFARNEFEPARWSGALNRIISAFMDEPRRLRAPFAGAADSPAENFVRSLGPQAGPFERSLSENLMRSREQAEVDQAISRASPLLAFGEGGVTHYHQAFPDDSHLSRWASLFKGSLLEHERNPEI